MGSFLDKPKTDKTNDSSYGNGLRYGVSAMQGWRIEMEDSHCSKIGLPIKGLEDWSFFAVFDGHAGGTVSKYSATKLLNSILDADKEVFTELAKIYEQHKSSTSDESSSTVSQSQVESSSAATNTTPSKQHLNDTQSSSSSTTTSPAPANSTSPSSNANKSNESEPNSACNGTLANKEDGDAKKTTLNVTDAANAGAISTTTTTTNQNTNAKPQTNPTTSYPDISKYQARLTGAIRQGFLDLDEHMRKLPDFDRGDDKSGSTAVACLISPSHVYLINCGDSRAVFASNNEITLSTNDHKPINPNERERILNAGGSVMIQRVNGSLAVSRALGDYEYKCVEGRGPCEQLVSPEPEIYECLRVPEQDEFAILACDGIWDVMSNEELREFIHGRLKVTDDLVKICNEVLDMCLNKGSRDNMSIIIVTFPGAPKVSQEHVERDRNCNERLEKKIKEIIESNGSTRVELSNIIHSISEEKWDDLPPGGGLYAKQSLIEEYYNKYMPRVSERTRKRRLSKLINNLTHNHHHSTNNE